MMEWDPLGSQDEWKSVTSGLVKLEGKQARERCDP